MRIKTKLQIISVFSITAVLVIGLALGLLSRRLEQESAEAALSDRGIEDMTELGNLAFEYFHYRNARAKRQWQVKYGRISEQLTEESYAYPEEQAIIGALKEDFKDIGRLFFNLAELRERKNSGTRDISLAQEQESLLINSYLSRSLSIVNGSFELSRMIREGEKRSHERFHLLIIVSVAILAAGTLTISLLLGRSVSKPIARLQEGIEIIGAGNLDYTVGLDSRDEIGRLSRAFDRMTKSLKHITASRNELEKEIAAREEAESKQRTLMQELEQNNKKLEQRLNEIKTLRGMLPICAYCKKIRDDKGYWNQLEMYISDHSEAIFSHGMCPTCAEKVRKEFGEFKMGLKGQ